VTCAHKTNPAPTPLPRLVKNTREDFVGKFRAKDVEGSVRLRIHHGFGERGSKRPGLLGPATQRFGQRPDETGILLGRLNLNAHETARRRATTVRTGRLALGFAGHMGCSQVNEILLPVI